MKDYMNKWLCLLGYQMPPNTFIHLMTQVSRPFMKKIINVYFNDILILFIKEELTRSWVVIWGLWKDKLYANPKKNKFLANKINFLECIISSTWIEIKLEKV